MAIQLITATLFLVPNLLLLIEGSAISSSFPTVGECTFPDASSYNRYQDTKGNLYPYQPVYGLQLFNESQSEREDITPQENPYAAGTEETGCPVGQQPPRTTPSTPDTSSTCPWFYTIDHDPNRIPTTVGRAVCRCKDGCLDPMTSSQRLDAVCREVTYRMKVLRRMGCGEGLFHYRVEEMEVVVACTCIRNS